jgi:hypothetical protein
MWSGPRSPSQTDRARSVAVFGRSSDVVSTKSMQSSGSTSATRAADPTALEPQGVRRIPALLQEPEDDRRDFLVFGGGAAAMGSGYDVLAAWRAHGTRSSAKPSTAAISFPRRHRGDLLSRARPSAECLCRLVLTRVGHVLRDLAGEDLGDAGTVSAGRF